MWFISAERLGVRVVVKLNYFVKTKKWPIDICDKDLWSKKEMLRLCQTCLIIEYSVITKIWRTTYAVIIHKATFMIDVVFKQKNK